MAEELIAGIIIEKKLDPHPGGKWPFVVYEVRDVRASAENSVLRVAYVFLNIDQYSWKTKLFERIKWLAEHPHERLVRPLEWGRTANGGFYYLQDKLPPVAEIPPERLWAFLTQAAQGLAILHKNDKPHGYLAYLVTAPSPKKPCRKEFSAQLVGRSVPTLVSWNLRHALDAVSATAKSANS